MDTLHISTVDLILTRMMNEPLFAEDVFDDAASALMEYNLPLEAVTRFKIISRPVFSAMTLDARKAFARWVAYANRPTSLLDGKRYSITSPCDLAVKANLPLNKTNPKRRNKKCPKPISKN